jgi:hypothetical protein
MINREKITLSLVFKLAAVALLIDANPYNNHPH